MSVLNDLKTKLGIGARLNKYRVALAAPQGPQDDALINTLCKGGAIPAKTMGQVEIMSQGRKLLIAGDAQYENTWTLTFWNTQDLKLRDDFDKWMLFIDDMENHSRGLVEHEYMSQGSHIDQLDTRDNDTVMASYQFFNLWPTQISTIDMADETIDTISEFNVDLCFSHWTRTA